MRELKRRAATVAHANKKEIQISLYRRLHEGCLIALLACGFFVLLSLVTYHRADPSWSHQVDNVKILNAGGRVGAWLSDFLLYLFGYITYFFPIIMFQGVWELYRNYQHIDEFPEILWTKITSRGIGFLMGLISSTSLLHLYLPNFNDGLPYESGGIFGVTMGNLLLQSFNRVGATTIFVPILLIGITLLTGASWLQLVEAIGSAMLCGLRYCFAKLKEQIVLPKFSFRMPKPNIKLNLFKPSEKRVEPKVFGAPIEPNLDSLDPLFDSVPQQTTKTPRFTAPKRLLRNNYERTL